MAGQYTGFGKGRKAWQPSAWPQQPQIARPTSIVRPVAAKTGVVRPVAAKSGRPVFRPVFRPQRLLKSSTPTPRPSSARPSSAAPYKEPEAATYIEPEQQPECSEAQAEQQEHFAESSEQEKDWSSGWQQEDWTNGWQQASWQQEDWEERFPQEDAEQHADWKDASDHEPDSQCEADASWKSVGDWSEPIVAGSAEAESQAWQKDEPSSMVPAPGCYVMCRSVPVTETMSRASPQVTELRVGSHVNVVEVEAEPVDNRIRARVESPAGWISIQYADGQFVYARRVSGISKGKGKINAKGKHMEDESAKNTIQEEAKSSASSFFTGILKSFNKTKGFGFISPFTSELPPQHQARIGIWFFSGAEKLPTEGNFVGKEVRFSIKDVAQNKVQATDVMLVEQDPDQPMRDAQEDWMDDQAWAESSPPSTAAAKPVPTRARASSGAYNPNYDRVILVSSLPAGWTVLDLEDYFARFGAVDSVFMLPNEDRSGCVVFSKCQGAEAASCRPQLPIHETGRGATGSLHVQHFPKLPAEWRSSVEQLLDDYAPTLAKEKKPDAKEKKLDSQATSSDRKDEKPKPCRPRFDNMRERLIGTVSNTVVSGMKIITCSKLDPVSAAFDPELAPEGALEGATVAFRVEENGLTNEEHIPATILEVLSRPSPENASRLAAAAAPSAAPVTRKRSAKNGSDREAYFKCFICKDAMKGRCTDEANCVFAHTLAEVRPLPETKQVQGVAKKLFGKASLLPMAAPGPMAFGMMPPPVWGMNPFMPSVGMPGMPGMMPPLFSMKKAKKRKR